MKKEQFAINSVSTRNTPLEESLAAYQAAGFTNVEFMLTHVTDYLEAGHGMEDVTRLLDEHSIRCVGGFGSVVRCFADADAQEESRRGARTNAETLAELGGSIMVIGTDGPGKRDVADPLEPIVRGVAQAADAVRDLDVTLCIEFNWSPIVKSLRTAADIARRTGRENVGVLFDPAHYHCTPTKFEQLTPENVATIRHVHVDDMRDKPGELSDCNADRVLPGEGCLDLPALLGRLEQYGYDGFYSIELFNEDLWAMPAPEATMRMYQSMLTLL